jgi:tripartite-type tricarboxylate transporter receptor subunit TctC
MKQRFVGFMVLLALVFGFAAVSSQISAQAALAKWPTKSLTIVVPYSPGGTNDRQARAIAPYLQKELGVPVKIENRPGGGTTVGYHTHKDKDPDDGSFILYGNNSSYCTAVIKGEYAYDAFLPLGTMSSGHPVLLVNPKHSDMKDFKDFLAKVKAKPNNYSQPVGPGWGKVFDLILQSQGYITRAIPVDGGSSDRVMFMAGDVDFYISDFESMVAIADPKEYKVLAIFSDISPYKELKVANDVLKEMGLAMKFPNMITPRYFQVKSEFKQKYPERFEFLAKALQKAAQDPEFFAAMKKSGYIFDAQLPEIATPIFLDLFKTIETYKDAF